MSHTHSRIQLQDVTNGDLVRVLGVNDAGEEEHWNAEVVGILRPDTLEVSYVEQTFPGIARFKEHIDEVQMDSVEIHVPVDANDLMSIARGWKHLGYLPLDEHDLWIHGEDIYEEYSFPHLGQHYTDMLRTIYENSDVDCSQIFDAESDDDEYEFDAESDEPFTEAPETNQFVRDTHDAVRAMSERYVVSDNERQKSVRDFLNFLHYKYT